MYTYRTMWNGLTIEILRDGESIFFIQGEDAAELLSQLEEAETDEIKQYILSQYDYA